MPRRWVPRVPRLSGARFVVVALVAYAFFSRAFIAVVIPPWQGPDEPKHFEYSRLLIDKREQLWAERRLLGLEDMGAEVEGPIVASLVRHHFYEYLGLPAPPAKIPSNFAEAFGISPTQLNRPSLYYDLGALALLPVLGRSLEDQLLAIRLLSALLASLAVLPAYGIGRLVAPHDRFIPVAAGALVAGLPMAVYIGGMVNNDNLLFLIGMVTTLAMTTGLVRGFSVRTWAVILGGVVLGLLTKRGAVILLPGVVVCAFFWFVRLRGPVRWWVAAFGSAGLVVIGLGAVSGWLARVLPLERAQSTLVAYALNGMYQWEHLLKVPIDSPETERIVRVQLDLFFKSFWGIFGYFVVPMRADVYDALLIATQVCAVGCLVWLAGVAAPAGQSVGRRLTVALAFLTLIVGAVVISVAERLAYYSAGELPQGRYLFVVLGPIAVLYALGARAWLPRRFLGTAAPVVAFVSLLVALDVYAFFGVLQPFFWRSFS